MINYTKKMLFTDILVRRAGDLLFLMSNIRDGNLTFNTVLVIFPKELGMMSSTGLVEWLDVLRLFWDEGTAQSKATRPSSLSCRLSRTNWIGLSHGQHAS